jgi:galactonate dehydratase
MSHVALVECFIVTLPRDVPYLGPLAADEQPNPRGYFVRRGNRTIYPTVDRTVLVKITAGDGTVGWGETYGIVAPRAVTEIINDVLAPVVVGRDPRDAASIWDNLYDLMRVRGHFGGFYVDAIAAVDIALWDLWGRKEKSSIADLLGGAKRDRIPAYVSGLPAATLAERVALAREWVGRGYRAVKFAAVVSHEGVIAEARALREGLGPDIEIMVDLHWKYSAEEAIRLATELAPYDLAFIEAPCKPEDIDGQAAVAAAAPMPVALGEELRTVHEFQPRFARHCMRIIQPEMGHTGITQFQAIGRMAEARGCAVIPHAAGSVGIFIAASLQAAATLADLPWHEYQHSIFDRYLPLAQTTMRCAAGFYELPAGPGHGVVPAPELLRHAVAA